MSGQHGGARSNQGYTRTAKQREHIRQRKAAWGVGGRFIPLPAVKVPTSSWWTCPAAEFSAKLAAELHRMKAQTTTYRYHQDEGI